MSSRHSSIPNSSLKRWILASGIAAGIMLLFMLLTIRPDKLVKILPQPLMELGYMILPPEPKEAPKQVKPPPPPPVKVIPLTPDPMEPPPAPAPVAPSDVSIGPADIQSSPATTPPLQQIADVRVQNASQLDNTNFVPIVNIKPEYPPVANKANIEGYVDVDLIINEKGTVESFSLASVYGHPSFGLATAKVVPKWRFPPPRIKGQKVRVKYLYRVNFTLN